MFYPLIFARVELVQKRRGQRGLRAEVEEPGF